MKKNIVFIVAFSLTLSFFISCTSDNNLNNETTVTKLEDSSEYETAYTYTSYEVEVIDLINNYRINIGLKPLKLSNFISNKCAEHDQYMIENNVLNHDNFDIRSQSIMTTLSAKKIGENVAYNFDSAKSVLDAWLSSPDHKKNIEGDYTHFGFSIQTDPKTGKIYYTNIFAKI
ncbi:CAP domain-containing protein [Flavobacterium sp. PL002]|uniref:CAP domain-containing protein n=1 Tax=Flavobacterium sp. PL002 TaxID=1897058 RepID=UPI001787E1F8|nr:CAP domain-containing protein [Flavobacterium sp. PL002]MBE0390429.1 hypothetical protein [Flavobacterium sp. PL002]